MRTALAAALRRNLFLSNAKCCNRLFHAISTVNSSMMESNWKIGTQTPATLSTPTASTTRQKYFLPKRIILLRHGESLGNIDANAYRDISDWTIPLTRRGERQSLRAAQDLWKLIQGEALFTYYSPYKRARETWEIVQHHLEEQGNVDVLGAREEPRIVEQQFGNYQNPHLIRTAKAERHTFGRFFFRFPNGEAGLDVYNRVSSFLGTLSRDIRQLDENPFGQEDHKEINILIVSHGLTCRLLLMRFFQLTVEEFENSYNSQNAKLVVMDRCLDPESGREYYRLDEQAKEALNLKGDVSNQRPVYWRSRYKENSPVDRGLRLFEEDEDDIDMDR